MENLEGSETVSFVFRLCIRPWDDVLLVSVLKGQNVSGIRKEKGRKDVLVEQISVVLLRVKLLQQQQRYTKDKQTFLGSNAVFEVFWVEKPQTNSVPVYMDKNQTCLCRSHRYRELCRYIKVTRTDDTKLWVLFLKIFSQ